MCTKIYACLLGKQINCFTYCFCLQLRIGKPFSLEVILKTDKKLQRTLPKKCPYSELFRSIFFRIRTEHGEIFFISPYSVRIRENTYQNNSGYGHFLLSG